MTLGFKSDLFCVTGVWTGLRETRDWPRMMTWENATTNSTELNPAIFKDEEIKDGVINFQLCGAFRKGKELKVRKCSERYYVLCQRLENVV